MMIREYGKIGQPTTKKAYRYFTVQKSWLLTVAIWKLLTLENSSYAPSTGIMLAISYFPTLNSAHIFEIHTYHPPNFLVEA